MSDIKDMQGLKFGKLYVLRRSSEKSPEARWVCTCDCGSTKTVSGKDLRKGHTKSCGCSRKLSQKKRRVPGLAARQLFLKTLNRAKAHKRIFCLSFDTFLKFSSRPCFYCGTPPSSVHRVKWDEFMYSGLDRVHNDEGYTEDNTVACCKFCNTAKSTLSTGEFIARCQKVVEFHSPLTQCSRCCK